MSGTVRSGRLLAKSGIMAIGLLVGLYLVGFGVSTASAAAAKDQEIVFLNAGQLSGAYAEAGRDQSRGVRLAIEEFGGKVLGKKIRLIERDVPNPSEAVRKAKEAVENEGAKFILVGVSSGVCLSLMEYAKTQKVVVGVLAGADSITGSACNRNTFRWQVPTYGAIREVVPKIIDKFNANSFFTITPDYVFGHDLLRNTEEVLKEKGKTFLGNAMHPMGETEYSQYITKAMSAKPDVVLFLNFGDDTVNALKQAVSFGVKQQSKIGVAWGAGLTQFRAIGTKVLEDVIVGAQYEWNIENPANKRLNEIYKKAYNELPTYNGASAYAETTAILMAIKKAGTTDHLKVIKTLEGLEYDGITGKEVYRACDHQAIKNYYTLRCKKQAEKKFEDDYSEIIGFSKNFPDCAKTSCKMN
jgi:branched-chain amino acid transport system substrate-binding protein